jgi:hypothetical protein
MLMLSLILIFLISVASTWWFGLWSNLITLVNLILAALIASSFFENVSFELFLRMKSYLVLLPFVSIWLLFGISFIVLRSATDYLSGMRLKFDRVTELVGRSLLSLAIAGVLISFVSFTLQLAPLPPKLFSADKVKLGGTPLGPDKLWHSFFRQCSSGSLSYTADETQFFPAYGATQIVDGVEQKMEVRIFDPADSFFQAGSDLRDRVSQMQVLRIPQEMIDNMNSQ